MRNIIFNLPEQIRDASQIPIKLKRKQKVKYHNIIIAGMGGSGIGGDILRALLAKRLTIPIISVKDYRLPAFVTKTSLVFTITYSGNTEETLETFSRAIQIGCRVIAVTSGGELLKRCKLHRKEYIEIPQGLSPRCAIGYLFIPLYLSLSKLGLIGGVDKDIQETVKLLTTNRFKYEIFARNFAKKLLNKLPMIYSTSPLLLPVAERWRKQFNENSEMIAHSNIFPELNHNEIMGIANPEQLLSLYFILLIDPKAHPSNLRRVDYTLAIIKQNLRRQHKQTGVEYKKFSPDGKSDLAKIFSLIMLGDLTSLYLAQYRGVAPELISAIDELKKKIENNKTISKY
jgi:glucose/mannose-6-phosphate isomerase